MTDQANYFRKPVIDIYRTRIYHIQYNGGKISIGRCEASENHIKPLMQKLTCACSLAPV
jgi:hypothetical protein